VDASAKAKRSGFSEVAGGESGIRNRTLIENKGSLLFSTLPFLNNRSFRRGLTHELTHEFPGVQLEPPRFDWTASACSLGGCNVACNHGLHVVVVESVNPGLQLATDNTAVCPECGQRLPAFLNGAGLVTFGLHYPPERMPRPKPTRDDRRR
jgi:hypothetical protein